MIEIVQSGRIYGSEVMVSHCRVFCFFFFFKQKTAYEMRISDWSSDVCSSDLTRAVGRTQARRPCRLAAEGSGKAGLWPRLHACGRGIEKRKIGRASCRERVCQYV